jgi:hypothetical protein
MVFPAHFQAGLVALFNSASNQLHTWLHKEIVADDPWDEETLFLDPPESKLDRSQSNITVLTSSVPSSKQSGLKQ